MTKYILTLSLLIFGLNAYSTSHEQIQKIAESVLDELYVVHGNTTIPKPTIVITDDQNEVASFRRRSHSILLSTKVFKVCSSFENDLRSALAFVIGHELSHAFQIESIHGTTDFLAHSAHPETREHLEHQADIQGVFMAHLAGYETTELLPDLIDRIYESYDLKSKTLLGYPTLSERQASNKEAILLTSQLLEIFEAGNYLTVIGEYKLAASCFEYIKNYYQGQEIYNNLGVNYALHALHLTDENIEPFVYPFEIEWNTRLRKPQSADGAKALDPNERRLREKYLTKAQSAFKKVLKNSPQNHTAKVHLISIYNLRGDYMSAINEFENNNWYLAPEADMTKATLVSALVYYRVGNRDKASLILKNLCKNSNEIIATQAACNLESLMGENICKNDSNTCLFSENERNFAKPVVQKVTEVSTSILLDEREQIEITITKSRNHKRLTFKQRQNNAINLYWDFDTATTTEKKHLKPKNLKHALQTSTGFLVPCQTQRIIYRLASDHTVLEKVFY